MCCSERPGANPGCCADSVYRNAAREDLLAALARREALDHAKRVIRLYESEIRERGLDKEGFCQGTVFREALADIERLEKG